MLGEYLPDSQAEHVSGSASPEALLNFPMSHTLQLPGFLPPQPLWLLPGVQAALHVMQVARPYDRWYLPAAHSLQLLAPARDCARPAGQ